MNRLKVTQETKVRLKEAFDIDTTKTNIYDIIKLIYRYKHSHTFLCFKSDKTNFEQIELIFNPWTLEIKRCYIKNIIGMKIKYFNGLSYRDFYKKNKKHIPITRRNCFNKGCAEFLTTNSVPFFLKNITLENDKTYKLTPSSLPTQIFQNPKAVIPFHLEGNVISIEHFILQDYDNEFRLFCQHILSIRNDYDEFIIHPGKGGNRKYTGVLLSVFFNISDVRQKKPELWSKTVIRREKKWENIKNDGDMIENVNRVFGDYIFQDENMCKKSYTGNIKLIIGHGVGSASYALCLYFLLIHGTMLIKKNMITTAAASKVIFVGKSAQSRVSNCFTGDSGGGMYFDLDEVSFNRTRSIWDSYKEFYLGHFLLGKAV